MIERGRKRGGREMDRESRIGGERHRGDGATSEGDTQEKVFF